ncbi:RNA polymerase I enhancer binding protein [Basidiobolus ranarum]|uniref:RNA polymerase I enhancer binding protein n=1 Tax=Basidiobolus ranarum TaxID=34480 RepID=A0ABR2WWJ3_9FUNG
MKTVETKKKVKPRTKKEKHGIVVKSEEVLPELNPENSLKRKGSDNLEKDLEKKKKKKKTLQEDTPLDKESKKQKKSKGKGKEKNDKVISPEQSKVKNEIERTPNLSLSIVPATLPSPSKISLSDQKKAKKQKKEKKNKKEKNESKKVDKEEPKDKVQKSESKEKEGKKRKKEKKERKEKQEESSENFSEIKSKSSNLKECDIKNGPKPIDNASVSVLSTITPESASNTINQKNVKEDLILSNKLKSEASNSMAAIVKASPTTTDLGTQHKRRVSTRSVSKAKEATPISIPTTASVPKKATPISIPTTPGVPKKATPISIPTTASVLKKTSTISNPTTLGAPKKPTPVKARKKAAPRAKRSSKYPLTPEVIPDDSDEEFSKRLPEVCGGSVFMDETEEEKAQRIRSYSDFQRTRDEVIGHPGLIEYNSDGISKVQQKFFTPKEIKSLEDTGYAIRKGKFSKDEDVIITKAVEKYLEERGKGVELIQYILFKKYKDKDKSGGEETDKVITLCQEVGKVVPTRTLNAIYLRLRRRYHPDNYGGRFTKEQEMLLHQLTLIHGKDWKTIGPLLGREPSSCRDRWRFRKLQEYRTGPWTEEEEEKLKKIVYSLTIDKGRSAERDISWEVVAEKMVTRDASRCRSYWYSELCMKLKEAPSEKEGLANTREFLKRIYESNVKHDSHIQWRELIDDKWSPWTPPFMQKTWYQLKSLITDAEDMSFEQVLQFLMRQNDKYFEHLSLEEPPLKGSD